MCGANLGKKVRFHIFTILAKCMTECYDYLFEIAVKMRSVGLDPSEVPRDSEYAHLVR
jgi:hypothetical protein